VSSVLVVEDFETFRQFIISTLQTRPELQVICQVADGLEAVQRAEELRPDLIVLDIGLPGLNGIEAARRIRKLSPESKVLFLSQESDADVVQEVFNLGARGYVIKAQAGRELLAAVESVLQGNQFVSSGLWGHKFIGAGTQDPDRLSQREPLPSPAAPKEETTRNHDVHIYSEDESLVIGFSGFVQNALRAGKAVVVVATKSHQKSLLQRLQAHGVNIADAIEQGSLIPLDVAETLSAFMTNDLPDPARFSKVVGEVIAAAAKAAKAEHPCVAACGECAPSLWAQDNAVAAIQVEHLWDEVARTFDVDILWGYVLTSHQRGQEPRIYESICAEHSAVYLR
jgi:DNA-binding NarL/FixJ family response regulator